MLGGLVGVATTIANRLGPDMPAELNLLVACACAATIVAAATSWRWRGDSPNWAVRAYLSILRVGLIPPLGRYAESRKKATRREQFLAVWFLTFFTLLLAGSFLLPTCGRHAC